jgi:hypothetical protein
MDHMYSNGCALAVNGTNLSESDAMNLCTQWQSVINTNGCPCQGQVNAYLSCSNGIPTGDCGACSSQAMAMSACLGGDPSMCASGGGAAACPSGSYGGSCTDIQCTSTEVQASCRALNGTYVNTQLSLPCPSVSNCNGQLTCTSSC